MILFLHKILYPKRRIESYCMMGTIVSPNKILLSWGDHISLVPATSFLQSSGRAVITWQLTMSSGVCSSGQDCWMKCVHFLAQCFFGGFKLRIPDSS